jgi:putative ABC transport system permease protein
MSSLLRRATLRDLVRHPWQTWLSVLGIALGVAVVVAVDVANRSAQTAFALSVERIAGRATHQIVAATGSLREETYVRLRLEQDLRPAAPVIEGAVRIAGRAFTLLGLDPFAALPFGQAGTETGQLAGSLRALLTEPGAVLLGEQDAASLAAPAGSPLTLEAGGRTAEVAIAGVLRSEDPALLEGLVLTDIAVAQELLGRTGEIDRIDLIIAGAGGEERAEALARDLPSGLRLVTAAGRTDSLLEMTRAFHTNLTAMSLLAVLVGGFIIYNTMTFAVLRRRQVLGGYRTLGVTRVQLFRLVLGESALFGLTGALIGILAGIAVGWGLVQLVTRTINDVYFALTVSELFISPWSLLKGAALGVTVTLVGALGPALEAAASQPRDVLRRHRVEQEGGRLLPLLALGGIVLLLSGFALSALSTRSIGIGFTALFLVVVGFSLGVPLVLRAAGLLLAPLLGRVTGPQGRLAARGITASISRTGIAVAALTVAVSATVGVSIMIDSFRGSLADWLGDTLASDIYVSAASASGRPEGDLPPGLAEAVLALPAVAEVSKGRSRRIETAGGPAQLLALASSSGSSRGFRFLGATAPDLWPRFRGGELILVSEPYAYHHQVGTGDEVELFTARGWRTFEIGGVFRDYGSNTGMLVLPMGRYAQLWMDPGVSTLGVILAEGADRAVAMERLRELAASQDRAVMVTDNRSIRDQSLAVFDRTFVITRVLRLLAVGVAFIGVLSALLALQLERSREYAILRATGVTRNQLTGLILLQTGIMGLAAGLLAIPLGWVMGDLLIQVINVRSFGWTMEMQVPSSALGLGVLLALTAALAAGAYPAFRSARTDPAAALREE